MKVHRRMRLPNRSCSIDRERREYTSVREIQRTRRRRRTYRAVGDIGSSSVSSTCPPSILRCICDSLRIARVRAGTEVRQRNVGDV